VSENESFDFPDPDHVVPAALGQPGQRVFSIQVHVAGEITVLKCEKQQMAALAEHLQGVLSDLPAAPAVRLAPPADLVPAWAIGVLGLTYDSGLDRVVVMAQEIQFLEEAEGDEGEEAEAVAVPSDDDAATARIAMTRGQVAAFIETATTLVEGGRPPCPICGRPLDPEGHICPRTNGHAKH
jgi:uncharacterized repeat protein (TIGR03847 family)